MQYSKVEKILLKKGFIFKHFEKLNSTMDEIKKYISTTNNYKYFIIADKQIKGIGRRGRSWESPYGNLYFSISFEMNLDIKKHFIFNLAASLAICEVIDKICKINSKIKWPNDILINKSKISGILSEIISINNKKIYILGVGINVESSPKISSYSTTYIKKIIKESNHCLLLELFINNFFDKYKDIENKKYIKILNNYKNKLLYLNQKIILKNENSPNINANFEDINLDGSMLVNINGVKKNIYSARIINDIN